MGNHQRAVCRIHRQLGARAGDLCEFRDRHHHADLAVSQLADPADRFTARVLLPEPRLPADRAPRATPVEFDARAPCPERDADRGPRVSTQRQDGESRAAQPTPANSYDHRRADCRSAGTKGIADDR